MALGLLFTVCTHAAQMEKAKRENLALVSKLRTSGLLISFCSLLLCPLIVGLCGALDPGIGDKGQEVIWQQIV